MCIRDRLAFQQCGHYQIIFSDLGQIDMLDMHKSYKLSHWSGHIASAFITGAATLSDADLAPEIMLIKAKLTADFTRVGYFFKEFHESALYGCGRLCYR